MPSRTLASSEDRQELRRRRSEEAARGAGASGPLMGSVVGAAAVELEDGYLVLWADVRGRWLPVGGAPDPDEAFGLARDLGWQRAKCEGVLVAARALLAS
jgi:hypothetical protein